MGAHATLVYLAAAASFSCGDTFRSQQGHENSDEGLLENVLTRDGAEGTASQQSDSERLFRRCCCYSKYYDQHVDPEKPPLSLRRTSALPLAV